MKRLARDCVCGKLGYESEITAMDAVISGQFSRAGVRVYQCPDSRLWHTTSKRQVPGGINAEAPSFTPTCAPVSDLSDAERTLIHAVRFVRKLRRENVKGEPLLQANNAVQAAMAATMKPVSRGG